MLNQADELKRLRHGTVGLSVPTAVERLIAQCEPERARTVFNRVRDVLDVVLSVDDWPSVADWTELLPAWFVAKCAEPGSAADERLSAEPESPWTVAAWTHAMHADQRRWAWWDGEVVSDHEILVLVGAPEWPTPTGGLEWLLRAAGATDINFA